MSPLPLAALVALLAFTAPAAAQTVINSVPYTITQSGRYVLGNNFLTEFGTVAVRIDAPNVILDLNGFFLSGPGNTPTSLASVIVVGNVSNVTVRNGTLANNGYGISFEPGANSINHRVENIRFTRCYIAGVAFDANAASTLVRGNTFSQIGGSTFLGDLDAFAIDAFGGVRIQRNLIVGVASAGTGRGFGIRMGASSFAIGNTISGCNLGVQGGKYQNNLTFNCATPFTGGTNAGGND